MTPQSIYDFLFVIWSNHNFILHTEMLHLISQLLRVYVIASVLKQSINSDITLKPQPSYYTIQSKTCSHTWSQSRCFNLDMSRQKQLVCDQFYDPKNQESRLGLVRKCNWLFFLPQPTSVKLSRTFIHKFWLILSMSKNALSLNVGKA